jgi:hypothetical protein
MYIYLIYLSIYPSIHLSIYLLSIYLYNSASALAWGLVFIPEGGILGEAQNDTALFLYNCQVCLFIMSWYLRDFSLVFIPEGAMCVCVCVCVYSASTLA